MQYLVDKFEKNLEKTLQSAIVLTTKKFITLTVMFVANYYKSKSRNRPSGLKISEGWDSSII